MKHDAGAPRPSQPSQTWNRAGSLSEAANAGTSEGKGVSVEVAGEKKRVRNPIHVAIDYLSNRNAKGGPPKSPRATKATGDSPRPNSARGTSSEGTSRSSSDADEADAEMSFIFNVLKDERTTPDKRAKDLKAGIDKFVAALQAQAKAESRSEAWLGDLYDNRLKERLEELPQQSLQKLSQATKLAMPDTPHPVLGQLDAALTIELARRNDLLQKAQQDIAQVVHHLAEGNSLTSMSATQLERAVASLKVLGMADDSLRNTLGTVPQENLRAIGMAASDVLDKREEPPIRLLLITVGDVLLSQMPDDVKAVDAQMGSVLDALASGDTSKIPSSMQAFNATAASDASSSRRGVFSFGANRDRLQWRLQTMPWNTLVDLCNAAAPYRGTDATADFMAFAALAEFVRRVTRDVPRQGAAEVLSQLSREHLNDLARKASQVIETAQAMVPNAPLAQRIPGTAVTTAFLLHIVEEGGKQLAIKVVEEDSGKSIAAMTAFEREELTWAMGVWRDLGLVVNAPPPDWQDSVAGHRDLRVYNLFQRLEREIHEASSGQTPRAVTINAARASVVPSTQTRAAQPRQQNRTKSVGVKATHLRAKSEVPTSTRPGGDRSTVDGARPTKRATLTDNAHDIRNTTDAANAALTTVLENLLLPTVKMGTIRTSCGAFSEAIAASNSNSSNAVSAEGQYNRSLKTRFENMPSDDVKRLHEGAENVLKLEKIGVIQNIEKTAKAELKRRETVLKSADPVMKDVLKALMKSKDLGDMGDLDVAEGVDKFIEIMKPINYSKDKSEDIAIAMYNDHLKRQLIELSEPQLKTVEAGVAKSFLEDAVVKAIGAAVKAQLQSRAAGTAKTSGQSS